MVEQRRTWFLRFLFFSKSLPGPSLKHSMSFVKTSPVFKQVRPSAVGFSLTFRPIRGQDFGMLPSDWPKLEEKTTFESPWYVAVCQRRLVNGAIKSGEVTVGRKPDQNYARMNSNERVKS